VRTRFLFVTGLFAAGLAVRFAPADDWPQFRGPNGSATSPDAQLPAEWGRDKNVAWKVKLPGYAWSCPVVWGDKVFVTTAVSDKQTKPNGSFGGFGGPGGGGFPKGGPGGGFPKGPGGMMGKAPDAVYKFELLALSAADGKVLWKQDVAERKPALPTNPTNGYATETPATDGERVYAYFGAIGTAFAYDLPGNFVWKAEVGAHAMQFGHGTASSPALADGRLFIQCDNEEKSFLVALDAKTGKELWRTPRTERTGWSSPLVWKNKVRTEVICVGSPKVRSYDPETGKQLWELSGTNGQIKATPVAGEDLLFVGSGGGPGGFGGPPGGGGVPKGPRGPGMGGARPLFAVKAGAAGDITPKAGENASDAIAWHSRQAGPATPSPLFYDDHLYVLEDQGGVVSCYDARTGKQLYKERIPGARSFTSSPWAYGGKVFCLDDAGTTHVLKAGADFEVIGANKLGEMAWSSPAVANGAVFLRTVDHLYCIRERRTPMPASSPGSAATGRAATRPSARPRTRRRSASGSSRRS
jgi:outer membrane protein assembly factor BamB